MVLCRLTYTTCLVYLDDIIVHARDFDTHLNRLRRVFTRFRAASLNCIRRNVNYFTDVEFLGHVLSEKGIEVQGENIKAVWEWSTPRNVTELRSFLGLCSYYRRFVDRFADIAAPLYRPAQKCNFWVVWSGCAYFGSHTRHANRKWHVLSRYRCSDTGLVAAGLVAVLSEDQNGTEVVIEYTSSTLTKPEVNYDVTRHQLLAVIFGFKTFRQ